MSFFTRGLGSSGGIQQVSEIDIEIEEISVIDIEIEESSEIEIEITEDGGEVVGSIDIKQGEAKKHSFSITSGGDAVDLTDTIISFAVKESKTDTEYLFEKTQDDFDFSDAVNGVVVLSLSEEDTQVDPDSYVAEIKLTLASGNIIKSDDIDFVVERSVFNAPEH